MKHWLRLTLVLTIGLSAALADVARPEIAALVRARELLGSDTWSTVLELERGSAVPGVDTALVFEFANALWFYRPSDGTQSLSQHWNNVVAERGRLLELLQKIDPACVAYREFSDTELAAQGRNAAAPPNGCFIESAAEARRLTRVTRVGQRCLLLYYVNTRDGLRGHTVLCYENATGAHVYDPAEHRAQTLRSASIGDQPMDLARRIVPRSIAPELAKATKIALG